MAKQATGPDKVALASASAAERDTELIKETFRGQEALLKNVRTLMLGGPLLPDQKENIKNVFSNLDLRALLRRRFLPDIQDDVDMQLGVVRDIWMGAEQMVFAATPQQIEQAMKYKAKCIEFTRHGLTLLENPEGMKVPFKVLPYEEDPLQIELMARNMYIKHVDEQLSMLFLIANQNEESPKEIVEKRIRNSNK